MSQLLGGCQGTRRWVRGRVLANRTHCDRQISALSATGLRLFRHGLECQLERRFAMLCCRLSIGVPLRFTARHWYANPGLRGRARLTYHEVKGDSWLRAARTVAA